MTTPLWWFVARSSGMVAWVMLTTSVIWGVVLSTKAFPSARRPAWLLDLHRWLGGLTIAFVVLHIGALLADSYTHFTLADVAVPFASSWKPGAVQRLAFGNVSHNCSNRTLPRARAFSP